MSRSVYRSSSDFYCFHSRSFTSILFRAIDLSFFPSDNMALLHYMIHCKDHLIVINSKSCQNDPGRSFSKDDFF